MRAGVDFGDERFEIDVEDARLIAAWNGPPRGSGGKAGAAVREALEMPAGFPPLRMAIVPGDRVTIAVDPDLPGLSVAVAETCDVLATAGVEPGSILVLATGPFPGEFEAPAGVAVEVHDPGHREQLAYLAATKGGRRIYLNRALTDADTVVPLGRLGYDPAFGYRGPWSTIFPGMGDAEAREVAAKAAGTPPRPDAPTPALEESSEVGWLLGSLFQVGLVPIGPGVVRAVSGEAEAVRRRGAAAVDEAWRFRSPSDAALVIAGIGPPGRPATLADLAAGLANAARLVRPGGKIVALSRVAGEPGRGLRRLVDAGDSRSAMKALRGHEGDADAAIALDVARALARADLYLLSGLDPSFVEDLGMTPMARPDEARRLAAVAHDVIAFGQSDRAYADVLEDDA